MTDKAKFRGAFYYKFLYAHVCVFHRLFYRKFTVIGYEKIPANTPVIFAPNHQNALMDALAVLFAARRPVSFMARADIFKKPLIAKILNFLKILPIYRIRDGFAELGRNQEVFDTTVEVLKSNIPLCILPEGNHEGCKRLRSLKKGIFRIAFQAEESAAYNLNLHIVPVGIDYSDYYHPGADLVLVFGTPIRLADYFEMYRENEQKAINTLVGVLSESMRSLIIHIPEEHYELTSTISEMYEFNVWDTCKTNRHPYNKLTIRQYIVHKITEVFTGHPEKAAELGEIIARYKSKLEAAGLNDCHFVHKHPRFLWLFIETALTILLLPFYLYGALLNFIPYKIAQSMASRVKDPNFRTSILMGAGQLILPVYHLVLIVLFCIFIKVLVLKILFAITLPVSAFFALHMHIHISKLWIKLRVLWMRISDKTRYNELVDERSQVIELIKSTIKS